MDLFAAGAGVDEGGADLVRGGAEGAHGRASSARSGMPLPSVSAATTTLSTQLSALCATGPPAIEQELLGCPGVPLLGQDAVAVGAKGFLAFVYRQDHTQDVSVTGSVRRAGLSTCPLALPVRTAPK